MNACEPYRLCFTFGAWCDMTPGESALAISHLTEALALADGAYLRAHPDTPPLDRMGIRYSPDVLAPERGWVDAPIMLARRIADCKAMAALRIAELRRAGFGASPDVVQLGGKAWHVRVRQRMGIEDPAKRLGMKG